MNIIFTHTYYSYNSQIDPLRVTPQTMENMKHPKITNYEKSQNGKNRFWRFSSKLNNLTFELSPKLKLSICELSKQVVLCMFLYAWGLFKRFYNHSKMLSISEIISEIFFDEFG